jgi:hypothetical protein
MEILAHFSRRFKRRDCQSWSHLRRNYTDGSGQIFTKTYQQQFFIPAVVRIYDVRVIGNNGDPNEF